PWRPGRKWPGSRSMMTRAACLALGDVEVGDSVGVEYYSHLEGEAEIRPEQIHLSRPPVGW
ncbi:MAG: hypothetical protein ACE5JM_10690, partial [Armatimonadota bacterium]